MDNTFSYKDFIDETGDFTSLFESVTNVWEVLPKIEDFIKEFSKTPQASEYTQISENVFVGKDVVIDSTSKIDGMAIIGHNSTIGHAAFVRGGVLIGNNVNVGHATEVKHSVILSNSALAHLNYVGDSIVGNDVNVSGGATLANFRLDRKSVDVKIGDTRIPTGLEKFGSVIGDGTIVGVNAVLNPGTILAKKTIIYPLVVVKGAYREATTFK